MTPAISRKAMPQRSLALKSLIAGLLIVWGVLSGLPGSSVEAQDSGPTVTAGVFRAEAGAAVPVLLDLRPLSMGDRWRLDVLHPVTNAIHSECYTDDVGVWHNVPSEGYEELEDRTGYSHELYASSDCPAGLYVWVLSWSYVSGGQRITTSAISESWRILGQNVVLAQQGSGPDCSTYSGTLDAAVNGDATWTGYWQGNIGTLAPTTCTLSGSTKTITSIMASGILRVGMANSDHPTSRPTALDFPSMVTTSATVSGTTFTVTWGAPGSMGSGGIGNYRDYTAQTQTGGSDLATVSRSIFSNGRSIAVSWGATPAPSDELTVTSSVSRLTTSETVNLTASWAPPDQLWMLAVPDSTLADSRGSKIFIVNRSSLSDTVEYAELPTVLVANVRDPDSDFYAFHWYDDEDTLYLYVSDELHTVNRADIAAGVTRIGEFTPHYSNQTSPSAIVDTGGVVYALNHRGGSATRPYLLEVNVTSATTTVVSQMATTDDRARAMGKGSDDLIYAALSRYQTSPSVISANLYRVNVSTGVASYLGQAPIAVHDVTNWTGIAAVGDETIGLYSPSSAAPSFYVINTATPRDSSLIGSYTLPRGYRAVDIQAVPPVLTYQWSASHEGTFTDGASTAATWAPDTSAAGQTVTLTMTVTGPGIATTTASLMLSVAVNPPGAPAAPSVATLSTSSLRATWSAPIYTGGETPTSYDLRYRQSGTSDWTAINDVSATNRDITTLTANTSYEVQVRATNSAGDSPYSASGTGTTRAAIPDVPSAPIVSVVSATELRVSWTAPTDYGFGITTYDLRYRRAGSQDWTDIADIAFGTTSYSLSGLDPGTEYAVQVRAGNANGDTNYSASSTATTDATSPDRPKPPTVEAASATSLSILWAVPDANGAAISSYDLRYRVSGATDWLDASDLTGTSYTLSSLAVNTEYEVQVRATNSIGDSAWSPSGMGRTATGVPDAPTAPTVASGGQTSLSVTWTAPADNGETISSYDLRHRRTGTTSWTNVTNRSTTNYTITMLEINTSYDVQVRATNSNGASPWSSSGVGTTGAGVPSAPSAPTVAGLSSTSIRVSWLAPNANGSAISSYDLRYRRSGATSWTDVLDLTGTSHAITALQINTEYEASVRATNENGDSAYSPVGSGRTQVGSTIATLSALSVSGTTFSFASGTYTYDLSVPYALTSTTLSVTPSHPGASYAVSTTRTGSGNGPYTLAVGANAFDIVVTAENGVSTQTYRLTLNRAVAPSSDASLSALTLTGVTITFSSSLTSYSATVQNSVRTTTVSATPTDPDATVVIGGADPDGVVSLSVGPNTIRVTVTAEDGITARTYTVGITRETISISTLQSTAFITSAPSVQLLIASRGTDTNSGIRWRVQGGSDDTLEGQGGITIGWSVAVFAAVGDLTPARTLDVTSYGTGNFDNLVIECGNAGFVNSDNANMCASVGTPSDVYLAERFEFTTYVVRNSDSARATGDNTATYYSIPEPEPANQSVLTLDKPGVEHYLIAPSIIFAVAPVLGTDTTEILLNNTLPVLSFSTDRTATSSPPLYTLRVQLTPQQLADPYVSYAIRGRRFAGDSDLTVLLSNGQEVVIPAYSYAYTPYTPTQYVPTRDRDEPYPLPKDSDDTVSPLMATSGPDHRVQAAWLDILRIFGKDAEWSGADSGRTTVVFVVSIALGLFACGAAGVAAGRTQVRATPVVVFSGSLVFTMCWGLAGPMFAGVPWAVALPPLVIPIVVLVVLVKSKI